MWKSAKVVDQEGEKEDEESSRTEPNWWRKKKKSEEEEWEFKLWTLPMHEQWMPTWTVRRITMINTICTWIDRWASSALVCLFARCERTKNSTTFYSHLLLLPSRALFFFRVLCSKICLFYRIAHEVCVCAFSGEWNILILLNLIFSHYELTSKHWSFAHLHPHTIYMVRSSSSISSPNENGLCFL